jgi:DNA-binding transcriptional MocR family regulator
MDALDRVAAVVLRLGDRVVVEHPCFPPLLDLLDQMGCVVVGVDVDDDGLTLAGLRAALAVDDVRAVFVQPRAQNPTGSRLTTRRAKALADLLGSRETIVVEDDHANDIASAGLVSLGVWRPDRTVHIRSYSKSHGPDLRLAAVGGAGDVVTAVANRRLLGPGWSSRILQALLLELLQDPATPDVMAAARSAYARRWHLVADVLGAHDVAVTGTDGINLWMGVADERSAAVALATRGIGVAPGDPFLVRPDDDHLRVTVGLVTGSEDRVREVAGHLAVAASRLPTRTSHHR